MKIYEAIIDNKEIMNHVQKNNIKFFDYPNAQEIKDVVIVIDPLDTPTPTDFGDNDNLTYEYFYQIDVFVKQKQGVNGRVLSDRLVFNTTNDVGSIRFWRDIINKTRIYQRI